MKLLGLLVSVASVALAAPSTAQTLAPVATFGHQVTGVAVSADGRRFVNFPRWTEDAPISVADHFVCVQSVVPDGQGNLWVVDAGAPGNEKILEGAPKLVKISLATNQVSKVIAIPGDVALQGTYLNDIRFSPDGGTAYITDSGTRGAIIVVDLASGRSWRALDGSPTTQVDKTVKVMLDGKPLRRPDGRQPMFAADGIAISNDGRTLYWQALTGQTLYSIDTGLLRQEVGEKERQLAVRTVARTQVTDGIWMSKAGTLYLTSPTDYSVKRLNGATVETVLTDRRLRWPDTMAEGADGTLYVTASHIQDSMWFKPGAPPALRTELFSFKPTR
jgi:sugar lactone lactonase YvrE